MTVLMRCAVKGALLVGSKSFTFSRPNLTSTDTRELWTLPTPSSTPSSNPPPPTLFYAASMVPKLDLKRGAVSAELLKKLKDKKAQETEARKRGSIVLLEEEPVLKGTKRKAAAKGGVTKKVPLPVRPAARPPVSAPIKPASGTSTPAASTSRPTAPLPSRPASAGSRPVSPDSKLQKRIICRLADRSLTIAQLAKVLGAPPERIKPFLEKVHPPRRLPLSMLLT